MAAWFRPKRYGLGLTPASWQGWVLTVIYIGIVVTLGLTVAETQIWVVASVTASTITAATNTAVTSQPCHDAGVNPQP